MSRPITILVVDDDTSKVKRICEEVRVILGDDGARVQVVRSAAEAVAAMRKQQFDLLVLDLNMPRRTGDGPSPEGGRFVLDAIAGGAVLQRPSHVFGLTAFKDIAAKQLTHFDRESWAIQYYDPAEDVWAERLARKLGHIAASRAMPSGGDYKIDCAVITAVDVEMRAVLALPADWRVVEVEGDESIYHRGQMGDLSMVACSVNEMGMPSAAAVAMKLIYTFRPRYLAMCGIAAGIGAELGDILVADQCWDYGSGKNRLIAPGEHSLEPGPVPILLNPGLKASILAFVRDGSILKGIQSAWTGKPSPTMPLRAIIGPVASGAAVVENAELVKEIRSHNRKLIGVEMETYGVFVAARVASEPRPLVLSVKSVSDTADHTKSDSHQEYAAFTSARFLGAFAEAHMQR